MNKLILNNFFNNKNRMPMVHEIKELQNMTRLSERRIESWFFSKIRAKDSGL
jgi:hypothetical protein